MADVKFIRKNGHIIPIRSGAGHGHSGGHQPMSKKAHTVATWKMTSKNTTAGSRFKDGLKAGAVVGGAAGAFVGSQMGLKGAIAGAAGGSAALGLFTAGAQAAFGPRKNYDVQLQSIRRYKGRK
jgi:hypothetical protein